MEFCLSRYFVPFHGTFLGVSPCKVTIIGKMTMITKGKLSTILIGLVTVYAFATGLWILFSELLAQSLIHDLTLHNQVTMANGLLYVAVSSSLLYFLLQR